MKRLTDFADEIGITNRIITGLAKLVSEDKALDILETMDEWRVVINYRTTTRHGQCRYKTKEVELHCHLMKPGSEEGRIQTTIHEIAHAVVPLIYDRYVKAHGSEWQRVMKAFGAEPKRCSSHESMNEFKMNKAKLVYACKNCETEFPAQRRKKHPPETYIHRNCGGRLYLKQNRVTGYRAA